MAVITCYNERFTPEERSTHKCSFCMGNLGLPLIIWSPTSAGPEIIMCGRCCSGPGRGLMLDIIQLQAIMDMRRIAPEYDLSLERKAYSKLNHPNELAKKFMCDEQGETHE